MKLSQLISAPPLPLVLGFLESPVFALLFFIHQWCIFLAMFSATLLSILAILLSPISEIKLLICGNDLNWLLNLNLNLQTLWIWVGRDLPTLMLGKHDLFRLIIIYMTFLWPFLDVIRMSILTFFPLVLLKFAVFRL